MKNKPYSLYKNSGIEWIGQIPSHWEVTTLRRIGKIQTSSVDKKSKELEKEIKLLNYMDVYNNRTKEIDNNIDFMKVTASQNQIKSSDVKKGDMFFTPSSETVDDIGHSAVVVEEIDNLLYSYHLLRLRIDREINLKFKKYLFNNYYVLNFFSSRATGTTRKTLGSNDFKEIQLIIPPLNEQIVIADFLDKKTARISELLERKKEQIKTLQKYRQSLIGEVVTKGLNKDVKTKDSGIEWIGEIPDHWEEKKIKHLSKILRGKFSHRPRNDPRFYDGKFPFIQTGDITNSNKYINTYSQTLNEKGFKVSKEFPSGTLVMTIAANIADLAILNFNACFPDSIVGFSPNSEVNLEYLYFNLSAMRTEFFKYATINTQLNLNVEIIGKLHTCLPPLEEQAEIVRYLNKKIPEINTVIEKIETQIQVLNKYRQSLIYEAVTGKIDVRNYKENYLEVE